MTDTSGTQDWLKLDWYPAGHVLLPQGGRLGKLFVLRAGEVEIERDGAFIDTVRQPGSVFGEMSLLLDAPHSATVRTTTDVEVFVVENALGVLEANPGWTLQIARLLARRVLNTTRRLAELQGEEDAGGERLVLPANVLAEWGDPQV